eukprot:CAMPEP_0178764626 /NCGR_PEP_ID=MMETSP0744-20121128/17934_1 /TAXON_ID=913974 /ORGANISM="Nitzschia punctata, Strain CCMP561" /LENGTH=73 /DNA_ID=CAMNT_0020419899 /DNA_START=20 /DNA_END=238 /DNA_ORIENTATION=-
MASMRYNPDGPILAILSGYSVTIWECPNAASNHQHDDSDDSKHQPVTRFPQGDVPLACITFNHNRQVLAACSA